MQSFILPRPLAASAPEPTRAASAPAPPYTAHSVRVTGTLLDDAQVRYTPGSTPHALLFLAITQGRGLPYEVRQDYGDDASAITALLQKVHHKLRRGAAVTVYASGITPRADHGHAVLRLDDVRDVIPHDTTHPQNKEH